MDFDVEKNFSIFDDLLQKRPEISAHKLKEDLQQYYLPYVQKLVNLKQQRSDTDGLVVGISAIQGTGKTTQGEILETLLNHFGISSISRSIDDHYITHRELCELRERDPRFIRRGVTHDIVLAVQDLKNLQKMRDGQPILISGYDKGAHYGDGDRFRWVNIEPGVSVQARIINENLVIDKQEQQAKALKILSVSYKDTPIQLPQNMGSDVPVLEPFLPKQLCEFLFGQDQEITFIGTDDGEVKITGNSEVTTQTKDLPNGWRVVIKRPDFIFYDGWMLGVRTVEDESVFDAHLPALETEEAKEFAKYVNKKLVEYEPLWSLFEFMTVLYVPNYQISLIWRDQAEEALRKKGEGMSHEEIKEFVYYFWRSVHPGIHIKNLAQDPTHTNQVVIINDDHTVREVLTPQEVKEKYY